MKLKLFHSTVLLFSLFSAAASAQDDAVAVDRGQKTFMRVGCYECHGTDGKGNEAGTALTPDTLPPEAIPTLFGLVQVVCRSIQRKCFRTRRLRTSSLFLSRCRRRRTQMILIF